MAEQVELGEVDEVGGTGPASRILGCSPEWVRYLVKTGRLKPLARTVDRTLIFDLSTVRAFKRARDVRK